MKIDWVGEFKKIRPQKLGIVVGVLTFFVGLVLGAKSDGIGWGLAMGFSFVLLLVAFVVAGFGVVALFASLLAAIHGIAQLVGAFIEDSPQLREKVLSFLRWLQSY